MASNIGVIGGIAERYSAALYDLADGARALDAVADDLRGVKRLLAGSADLSKMVRSPLIRREAKRSAVAEIMARAGVSDLTRRFVGVVARKGRLFALDAMIDAYLAELARRRGEVVAEVVAARALDDGQRQALAERLQRITGGTVTLDLRVDPGLIGGLVVRVGSRMYDASVRSRLERLRLVMKGA